VLLFLSPWIIGFAAFTAGPMALSLYYSFTHYDILSSPTWIGLANYEFMFGIGEREDPFYWQAVRNTLWIIAFGVPLRIAFGLATAILLTRPKRGVNVYRTLIFMPSMIPRVGSALVFVYLFNPATGPVNRALDAIPFIHAPLWFFDPQWAKPGLLFIGLWGIGDAVVLYLAGLLDVPRQLYESISIEGANRWQRFRYVTGSSTSTRRSSWPATRAAGWGSRRGRSSSTGSGCTSRRSGRSTWATPRRWRGCCSWRRWRAPRCCS
jgi:multiple sugar transport system permease protein